MAIKLKTGDNVKVISGASKGSTGKVLQVIPSKNMVVVEGVNIVKKHIKPVYGRAAGSIQEINKPIAISKVAIIADEKTLKTSRIGYKFVDGKKVSKRIDGEVVYREQFDRPISDVFTDIPRIPNTGAKVIGYATQKPKELISRFVLASTNEGDVVADYYMGSGTTAVVCKELNRNFIGCDINPKAIEITNARLDAVS